MYVDKDEQRGMAMDTEPKGMILDIAARIFTTMAEEKDLNLLKKYSIPDLSEKIQAFLLAYGMS